MIFCIIDSINHIGYTSLICYILRGMIFTFGATPIIPSYIRRRML